MAKRDTDVVERIHQSVARQLGTAIVRGTIQPGATIDGEIAQSAAMGVSRTPYREAVRMLVAKGLIESRPKSGTRVSPRARWNLLDPDVLAWMFSGSPDERFVRDLFELRGVLEPAAAHYAAIRKTPAQIADMADCIEQMRSHGLAHDEGTAADKQFHRLILAASQNETFVTLGGSIGAAVEWTTRFKQRAHRIPRDSLPDHEAVFVAIRDGDAAAARAAMHHLLDLAYQDMELG